VDDAFLVRDFECFGDLLRHWQGVVEWKGAARSARSSASPSTNSHALYAAHHALPRHDQASGRNGREEQSQCLSC
jgi:hypothetical protein